MTEDLWWVREREEGRDGRKEAKGRKGGRVEGSPEIGYMTGTGTGTGMSLLKANQEQIHKDRSHTIYSSLRLRWNQGTPQWLSHRRNHQHSQHDAPLITDQGEALSTHWLMDRCFMLSICVTSPRTPGAATATLITARNLDEGEQDDVLVNIQVECSYHNKKFSSVPWCFV